jgi:hypothetical protein
VIILTSPIEPELVQLIEEIVARRLKEELAERAQMVTIDQFTAAMERIDRRFEASEKRFDAMEKRFDAMEKRFDAMQNQNDNYARDNRDHFNRIEGMLENVLREFGKPFEQFGRNVIARLLAAEGWPDVKFSTEKYSNPERIEFPHEEVEIDGVSKDPPVLVEVTSILQDQEKIDKFLQKKRFLEQITGVSFRGFIVAATTSLEAQTLGNIIVELKIQNVELINL